jgi:tetratricopeptide (TPR) repeat protein
LAILCAIVTVGTIIHLNRQKAPTAPVPVAESSPKQMDQAKREIIVVPKPEEPQTVSENAKAPAQIPVTNPVPENFKPEPTAFSKTIDALISPRTTLAQKHALFQQMQKAGGLDHAIAELKQRAADNPNDPQIPTALGEAEINKLRAISETGGNFNEVGILAMQADQSFDAALKLDPSNWEAQLFKAASLANWPPEMNKGQEAIQRFSNLIDQQETMTPQPQFAQTYVLLGEQYQKAGKLDCAQTTWQLGLAKFPGDPTLQKKISGR